VDTFFRHGQLAALDDLDRLHWHALRRLGHVFDLLDGFVALEDFAEDDVAVVEPTVMTSGGVVSVDGA
jgi:hypothetical protein